MEREKQECDKTYKMIDSYFNKIKKGNYYHNIEKPSDLDLKKYFNGDLKMQSKNIYIRFVSSDSLVILNFDKCSFYIHCYRYNQEPVLMTMKVTSKDIRQQNTNTMPLDRDGDSHFLMENDLL